MKFLSQNFVKYALIMSMVLIATCILLSELTGQLNPFDKSPLTLAITLGAPIIVWYLALRSKKTMLKGKMTFKQGVTEGTKIALVYGTIAPFIFLIYYQVNPSVLQYVQEGYRMEGSPYSTVIIVDMIATFFGSVILGTIISALISLFLSSNLSSKKK